MWLLPQQSGIAVQSTFGHLDVRPVTLPAFDAERGLQWSSSREEYDAARADERYAFEQFTYESEGLTVGAYLYRPQKRGASPLPVIVYNRGSYTPALASPARCWSWRTAMAGKVSSSSLPTIVAATGGRDGTRWVEEISLI